MGLGLGFGWFSVGADLAAGRTLGEQCGVIAVAPLDLARVRVRVTIRVRLTVRGRGWGLGYGWG